MNAQLKNLPLLDYLKVRSQAIGNATQQTEFCKAMLDEHSKTLQKSIELHERVKAFQSTHKRNRAF